MPGATLGTGPRSQYTSDPALGPFLGPSFDPTAYLNSTLPQLFIASPAIPNLPKGSSTITDLASRTQAQLTQLSALSARLTAVLTQLTDDILRSGARLAYDVELLRGEAVTLTEILTDGLSIQLEQFVPNGISIAEVETGALTKRETRSGSDAAPGLENPTVEDDLSNGDIDHATLEPEALIRLRTLHHIRSKLQSVIATFDLALSWPLPPSATSTSASNFIAVSAPSSGQSNISGSSPESLEAKGQAAQQRIRNSVAELLAIDRGPEGVLKAEERIDHLQDLIGIWKGTSEEKYRTRFVETLAKMVSDRRLDEEAKGTLAKRVVETDPSIETKDGNKTKGLLGGLRRLRDEIYLD